MNEAERQRASSAPDLTDSPPPHATPVASMQVRLDPPPSPTSSISSMEAPLPGSGGDTTLSLKIAWRRLLKEVASLPLAIGVMFTIAGLSGLGTIIPQNKVLLLPCRSSLEGGGGYRVA